MAKVATVATEYLIGIDEAGRGPLAGPVSIGVSFIPKVHQKEVFSLLKKAGLNDSKQVKEKTRGELYRFLLQFKKESKINFAVTLVPADIISTEGIVFAINFGIKKGLQKILARHSREGGNPGQIILELDGALRIPQNNWKEASIIIKGDTIKPSIMIASILAKVTRDRYMKKISVKHSLYNFEIHKGYGTKKHRELIKKHGLCEEHRVGWYKGM
jgi:ribonuclease HII